MRKAFIWLSGLRFIDEQNYQLLENNPARGTGKIYFRRKLVKKQFVLFEIPSQIVQITSHFAM